ncbi:MAG: deoxyribose-phosphate aldolase [Maribacter sp.]|nr:deoxyribose-phosphate aldolase [Maribacter sp.]
MKKMNKTWMMVLLVGFLSCKQNETAKINAQRIVDKSIEVSGGERYKTRNISFDFRDRKYVLERIDGKRILKRILKNDTLELVDIKSNNGFERYRNGKLAQLPDSLISSYANAVNSVHYFAYLPYGLNDPAVNKEYLGEIVIKDKKYYKIKVTFNQENGGDDYDDVYLYWFNTKSFKPDYLAYEFHVNDGGLRFREAFNERTVNGIRFVDYINYKPIDENQSIDGIESLFQQGKLEVLSKIELKNISVNPGNYN